jgi:hypothetical protein
LTGYSPRLKFRTGTCGWLFVRTRNAGIVVIDPTLAIGEDPDGSRYVLMTQRTVKRMS